MGSTLGFLEPQGGTPNVKIDQGHLKSFKAE